MLKYSEVSRVLAAYLEVNHADSLCEDLLRVVYAACSPFRPHLFDSSTQKAIHYSPFRLTECIIVNKNQIVVYPKVLASSDGTWQSLATVVGSNAVETAVFRHLYDVISRQVVNSDCWRVLVNLTVSEKSALTVSVTISNLFRRREFRHCWVDALNQFAPVTEEDRKIRLLQGKFFVDQVEYAMIGNFLYTFLNKLECLSEDVYLYCEGGILLAIEIDHFLATATVSVIDTLGYSAINLFAYCKTSQVVGVLLSSHQQLDLCVIGFVHAGTRKLRLSALTPVKLQPTSSSAKFPFGVCMQPDDLRIFLTVCSRGAPSGAELVELTPRFVSDLALC